LYGEPFGATLQRLFERLAGGAKLEITPWCVPRLEQINGARRTRLRRIARELDGAEFPTAGTAGPAIMFVKAVYGRRKKKEPEGEAARHDLSRRLERHRIGKLASRPEDHGGPSLTVT
jgi:hypothetical protein